MKSVQGFKEIEKEEGRMGDQLAILLLSNSFRRQSRQMEVSAFRE